MLFSVDKILDVQTWEDQHQTFGFRFPTKAWMQINAN